jgi:hypothetical protein
MHDDARRQVAPELVEARLDQDIRRLRSLTAGWASAAARVHNLPDKPSDIEDDGDFHYAVLGPAAASESGKEPRGPALPEENTGPRNPRKERNAVVLAVPSSRGACHGPRNHSRLPRVGGRARL